MDVEFLEDYGRYLDYETARRNPLLLPHAHRASTISEVMILCLLSSNPKGRSSNCLGNGANTDAEKQLLTELRAMASVLFINILTKNRRGPRPPTRHPHQRSKNRGGACHRDAGVLLPVDGVRPDHFCATAFRIHAPNKGEVGVKGE